MMPGNPYDRVALEAIKALHRPTAETANHSRVNPRGFLRVLGKQLSALIRRQTEERATDVTCDLYSPSAEC
jgi:hypothetical protein